MTFPAHWAPNDLLFYKGTGFPEKYRGGAFIAFHGSWNRAPLPQQGFKVGFVAFEKGLPKGDWEIFADGSRGAKSCVAFVTLGIVRWGWQRDPMVPSLSSIQ